MTGIYKISNTVTGQLYIGQARDIEARWTQHLIELNAERHHCPKLMAAWKRHGHAAFKFEVIEECSLAQLDQREWFWMVGLRPHYNGRVPRYEQIDAGLPQRDTALVTRARQEGAVVKGCERCGAPRKNATVRYCNPCKKVVLSEMREAGYLTHAPTTRKRGDTDSRQERRGDTSPGWENAVRAWEAG